MGRWETQRRRVGEEGRVRTAHRLGLLPLGAEHVGFWTRQGALLIYSMRCALPPSNTRPLPMWGGGVCCLELG